MDEDYTNKFSLKAKKPAGPVTVTVETEQDKTGALTSKVGTKFSYAKFSLDKGQMKADGSRVVETSLAIAPEWKLNFKSSKGADLGFEYNKGSIAASGALDVMEMSKLSGSACYGLPSGVVMGLDASYNLKGASSGLTSFNYGLSYSSGPMFASVTGTSKSVFTVGMMYKATPELTLASESMHSANTSVDVKAIGAAYKFPSGAGTLKAKLAGDGLLSACFVTEVAPKVTLTASGSVSTSNISSTFKPGISISM